VSSRPASTLMTSAPRSPSIMVARAARMRESRRPRCRTAVPVILRHACSFALQSVALHSVLYSGPLYGHLSANLPALAPMSSGRRHARAARRPRRAAGLPQRPVRRDLPPRRISRAGVVDQVVTLRLSRVHGHVHGRPDSPSPSRTGTATERTRGPAPVARPKPRARTCAARRRCHRGRAARRGKADRLGSASVAVSVSLSSAASSTLPWTSAGREPVPMTTRG